MQKPVHAFSCATLLPAPDAGLGLSGLTHDRVRAEILGAEQDDLRSPHVLLRGIAVLDQIAKPINVGWGRKGKRRFACRRPASCESAGNPYGDSNVRLDPLETARRPHR
jgi:hypothetical protein